MAARISDVEFDVNFDPERIARDLGVSLAGALSEIAGRLLAAAYPETGEDRPTDPQIIAWPNRTQPPVLIVRCPVCDESVETTPMSWEIVIDPTSTADAVSVRGLVQHTHEDPDVDVRWPFAAVWTPPPAEPLIDAHIVEPDEEDIEEGQAKHADDAFEFTPDEPGEPVSVRSAVHQALGAASVAWEGERPQGVFDSTWALAIGEALLEVITRHVDERVQSAEDERTRLDQIIYRARTRISGDHDHRSEPGLMSGTPTLRSTLDGVRDILAAVDGPDSPTAKRLRGEA